MRIRGSVGPDLSGINNKTKDELLTSILNPSYAIEPQFTHYIVTTKDGHVHDGILARETPAALDEQRAQTMPRELGREDGSRRPASDNRDRSVAVRFRSQANSPDWPRPPCAASYARTCR